MSKKVQIFHRIFIITSIAFLLLSLVFYLIRWNSLPDEPGVHFGSDCQFDVYGSKFYGFYPHLVGAVFTAGFWFAGGFVGKKNTGLHVDETGERRIKNELCVTLDIIMLLQALFFSYWSLCVSLQQPLNNIIAGISAPVLFGTGLAGFIIQTVTYIRHRIRG